MIFKCLWWQVIKIYFPNDNNNGKTYLLYYSQLPGKTPKEHFYYITRRPHNTIKRCNLTHGCHTCPQPQSSHDYNGEEETWILLKPTVLSNCFTKREACSNNLARGFCWRVTINYLHYLFFFLFWVRVTCSRELI